MEMEEAFLESRLLFLDVPADQIPLNADRVERFFTQSGRFFVIELTISKFRKKKQEKN